eukprot:ANDGO_04692.mRNA.1 hypothetical protein
MEQEGISRSRAPRFQTLARMAVSQSHSHSHSDSHSHSHSDASTNGVGGRVSGGGSSTSGVHSALLDLLRKAQRKRACYELVVYIPFLMLFVAYMLLGRGVEDSYFVRNSFRQSLVMDAYFDGVAKQNFLGAYEVEEIWQWVENTMTPYFWKRAQSYAGTPIPTSQRTYVSRYNKMLGAVRVRQVRVSDAYCDNGDAVYRLAATRTGGIPQFSRGSCYASFETERTADTGSFQFETAAAMAAARASNVSAAFVYHSCDRYYDTIWGQTRILYPCSGFWLDIPVSSSYEEAQYKLAQLKDLQWIDRFTSALIIEFFAYNPGPNQWTRGWMLYEFSVGGMTLPSYTFSNFKLRSLQYNRDIVVYTVILTFYLYLLYYFAKYTADLMREGLRFFTHFWNWFDTANLSIFVAVLVIRVVHFFSVLSYDPPMTGSEFPSSLIYYSWLWGLERQLNAFNAILVFLRVFKFLQLNDRLNLLGRTLSVASGDLIGFFFMFAIVFVGYSTFAYLLYGSDIDEFRTWLSAATSTFFIMLGDFDYARLREVNRILTPIFFFSFIVVAVFILFNMFLAIINDSYSDAVDNARDSKFGEQLKRWWKKYKGHQELKKIERRRHRAVDLVPLSPSPKASSPAMSDGDAVGSPAKKRIPDHILLEKLKSHLEEYSVLDLDVEAVQTILGSDVPKADVRRIVSKLAAYDTNHSSTLDMTELNSALRKRTLSSDSLVRPTTAPSPGPSTDGSSAADSGAVNAAETTVSQRNLRLATDFARRNSVRLSALPRNSLLGGRRSHSFSALPNDGPDAQACVELPDALQTRIRVLFQELEQVCVDVGRCASALQASPLCTHQNT